MASRVHNENSGEVGAFVKLTNKFCLISAEASDTFINNIAEELEMHMPVISTTIAETRTLGRMCVANSRGLILPSTATEDEIEELR